MQRIWKALLGTIFITGWLHVGVLAAEPLFTLDGEPEVVPSNRVVEIRIYDRNASYARQQPIQAGDIVFNQTVSYASKDPNGLQTFAEVYGALRKQHPALTLEQRISAIVQASDGKFLKLNRGTKMRVVAISESGSEVELLDGEQKGTKWFNTNAGLERVDPKFIEGFTDADRVEHRRQVMLMQDPELALADCSAPKPANEYNPAFREWIDRQCVRLPLINVALLLDKLDSQPGMHAILDEFMKRLRTSSAADLREMRECLSKLTRNNRAYRYLINRLASSQ